jgi:hypothetical protein
MAMHGPRNETRASVTPGPRLDGRDAHASARAAARPKPGNGPRPGAPRAEENGEGTPPRKYPGRKPSEGPDAALCGLLRGLHAGDLESVLLTVEMAAEENRMPCADPDEVERILAFLARLAEHDAALPPCPGGAGFGSARPLDAD